MLKIAVVIGMLGLATAAFADPKDLDPNAHPLPPQAIGSSANAGAGPPIPGSRAPSAASNAVAAPSGPCIRGQSSIRLGGIDIDEIKCELAVVRMERAATQERLERIIAVGSMMASDLAMTRESAKQHESALAEWFKGYFGEPAK